MKTEKIALQAEHLLDMRYPTMLLVLHRREALPPSEAVEIAAAIKLRHVDYVRDVLSADDGPIPGGYSWTQFRKWLKEEAQRTGGILVDQADAMITTWSDRDRETFFREFLRTEIRAQDGTNAPAVLVSALAAHYDLPEEERGQGIVLHIHGEK